MEQTHPKISYAKSTVSQFSGVTNAANFLMAIRNTDRALGHWLFEVGLELFFRKVFLLN